MASFVVSLTCAFGHLFITMRGVSYQQSANYPKQAASSKLTFNHSNH